MHTLVQDLRYAARMLVNKPGFTLIAVLTLALGIGANTAIFSVIDATVLRPVAYKNPDQLVFLNSRSQQRGIPVGGVSLADFLEWKQQAKTIAGMSIFRFAAFTYAENKAHCAWLV